MESDFLVLYSSEETTVSCAIRIKAPENVTRVPTHIILLIDVSESMIDDNKLVNVKKCAGSIVNFLNDSDTVSLITFGESAEVHLKQVPADQVHKDTIRGRIDALQVNGCTNLSAGLGLIQEVCEGSTQKSGLLLLTDGHANRGVSDPNTLREIVSTIHGRMEALSIHCVGYGHDHNADLLQGIAQSVQGSYNIVNSIEDTAFAFGETLGGLMSCAFQNVAVSVPKDSIVHGPYITRSGDDRITIHVGDVYSGTKPLILVDIPRAAMKTSTTPLISISGMELSSFTVSTIYPIPQDVYERQQDVELTRLRYTCTEILDAIKGIRHHDSIGIQSIKGHLDTFVEACADPFLDGHPVSKLLRGEIATMRTMINRAEMGDMDQATNVLMTQRITSIALGRGFSSPAVRQPHVGGHQLRRWAARSVSSEPEDENPQVMEETQFAFQNTLQSQIATLMREESQHPHTS